MASASTPAWSVKPITGLFASPGVMGLIARLEGRPVGFVLCRQACDESEMLALGVAPDKRRGGIARALLGAAMARGSQDGVQALFLEVAEDNVAARALYGSAGFTAVGRRPNYNRKIGAEPVAALVLRREITSS